MTEPLSTPSSSQPQEKQQSRLKFVLELLQIIVISAVIVIPIRTFVMRPFYVKGASMEPNFFDHEYLFVDKFTYRSHAIERGDVVVFRYPLDPSEHFIKRVIGLPGETVEVAQGKVKIYNKEHENGMVLDEAGYLDQDYTSGTDTRTLKDDEYYLMGDNRAFSLDSRSFGPVKKANIVGRTWVRLFPPDRWEWFSRDEDPYASTTKS